MDRAAHWVSGLTMRYGRLANAEIWNYALSVSQGVQFGEYGEGGTYDWHKDEFDQPFGDEAPEIWRGQSRKISIVVNLSPPEDYDGGELMFKDTYGAAVDDPETMARIRQQGSVVVFPSYILHTVTPVTRGTRCSLVSWILGPPAWPSPAWYGAGSQPGPGARPASRMMSSARSRARVIASSVLM